MTLKIRLIVSYKFHILAISLAAILAVILSTGVVEALLNIEGNEPSINCPLCPMNFTVANLSNEPITVTKITIVTDNDKFKFNFEENLSPGEDFIFAPEIGPISGIPKVTILAENTFGSMSDPDDPGKLTVSFLAPPPGEEPNTQVDFLSAIRSTESGTAMGVIIENTSPDTLKVKKIKLPKVDSDPDTGGIQPWVLKINQNLAAGDSLKMKFNVEDVNSDPIVLDDGQKVKVKLITKTNDGMRFKIIQKVIVNEGIGTSP